METRFSEETGILIHARNVYNVTLKKNETCWGHFNYNDGQAMHVGPWYKTKAEILADHESYLVRAGWLTR